MTINRDGFLCTCNANGTAGTVRLHKPEQIRFCSAAKLRFLAVSLATQRGMIQHVISLCSVDTHLSTRRLWLVSHLHGLRCDCLLPPHHTPHETHIPEMATCANSRLGRNVLAYQLDTAAAALEPPPLVADVKPRDSMQLHAEVSVHIWPGASLRRKLITERVPSSGSSAGSIRPLTVNVNLRWRVVSIERLLGASRDTK